MKRNKKECIKCNIEISLSNYNKHVRSCNGDKKQRIIINEKWKLDNGRYKCPFCEKDYGKKGIGTHIWKTHTETGKLHNPNRGYENGTRDGWAKGLTKETDERIKKQGRTLSSQMKLGIVKLNGYYSKKYHESAEHKINSSKGGGYREKSGRSKGGYALDSFGKKVWLQSSFEIRCSKLLDELNIKWIRPSCLYYEMDDKTKKYFPDFYLTEYDIYLDPKNNYLANIDKDKINAVIEQNDVFVHILLEKDLNKDSLKGLLD